MKICLFKFTFQGGRTWALCWEVANFLERNVWGLNKSCFSNRALESYWGEGEDWLERAWNDLGKQLLSEAQWQGWGLQLQNKTKQINEVASFFCNTRGRPGLHFNPVSLTKIVSRQSHIINFLRWLRGLLHLFCLTLTSSLSVIS